MITALVLAAAASAAPPAASAPARPPDATYSYTVLLAGAATGTSTVSIDGSAGTTIVVKETAHWTTPRFSATSTMRYDTATLRETGYNADFTLPSGAQHTDVTFKPGALTVSVPQGSADIAADPAAPFEVIGDNLIGSCVLFPALIHANGLTAFTFAALSGAKALPARLVEPVPAPVRPASVPAADVRLSLDIAGLREDYWYDPATYVVHDIAIPAQGAEFRLTATANAGAALPAPAAVPTALPTATPRFTSRDVRLRSADGTVLAGTLTVPERGARPFATIVLVHGSGAEDRDETIGPNPIFLQLSNALSNAGYAVLRYDKRGVAQSGGSPLSATRDALLADVDAAYRFVRAQPEVDPSRVFLLGHSEGGELVPAVAAREAGVAGLILMAPPALPLWQIALEQVLAGVAPAQRAATRTAELGALAQIRRGEVPRYDAYRTSMDLDPVTDIKRVHRPILMLQGLSDVQVLPQDLPRLVSAARAANHDVTVRTFTNDNHLFEPQLGGPQTPVAALRQYLTVPARVDPRVIDAIVGWLKTTARANHPAGVR